MSTSGRDADMLFSEVARVRDPNNTSNAGRAPSSKRRVVADDHPPDAHASTAPMGAPTPGRGTASATSSEGPLASAPAAADVTAHRVVVIGDAAPSAPALREIVDGPAPRFAGTLPHGLPAWASAEAASAAPSPRSPDRTDEIDMSWLTAHEVVAASEQSTGQIMEALWDDDVYQESELDAAEHIPPAPARTNVDAEDRPVPRPQPEPIAFTAAARTTSHVPRLTPVVVGVLVIVAVVIVALTLVAFFEHWWPFYG